MIKNLSILLFLFVFLFYSDDVQPADVRSSVHVLANGATNVLPHAAISHDGSVHATVHQYNEPFRVDQQ